MVKIIISTSPLRVQITREETMSSIPLESSSSTLHGATPFNHGNAKKRLRKKILRGVLLLFAFFFVCGLFFLMSTRASFSIFPFVHHESPRDQIIHEVEKQYLLPANEVPQLAIITSLNDLKGQAFFDHAEVGDVVLMYLVAKMGILWRPRTHQIIEVGPLSVKEVTPLPSSLGTSSQVGSAR